MLSDGATLVFYAAIFPRLARNTPEARELRRKYESKEITAGELGRGEMLEKNKISNISTVSCSPFYTEKLTVEHFAVNELKVHSNIG